jgi:hypothetical protein
MVIREPLRDVWHPQYECMNSSRNATKRPLHGVMLMSILACIANALAWRAIEGDPKSAGTIIQCALAALLLIHLLRAVMHAVFRKPAPRHGRHADRGRISSVRTFTDECVGESAVAPRCADEYARAERIAVISLRHQDSIRRIHGCHAGGKQNRQRQYCSCRQITGGCVGGHGRQT